VFKRILLPTDGSDLSIRAVNMGIALAARLDAQVFAFHVAAPFPTLTYFAETPLESQDAYTAEAIANAERYLADVRQRANSAGIFCESGYEFDRRPYTAIIGVAKKHMCDLIVMGTNSWQGFDRLMLGNETHKVTLNSDVPILVCH